MSQTPPNRSIGWRFPFAIDSDGRTATVGGKTTAQPTRAETSAAVQQSVAHIVLTAPGERVMLGGFGAGLNRYLFTPMSDQGTILGVEVRRQVEEWSMRANVARCSTYPAAQSGKLTMLLAVHDRRFEDNAVMKITVGGPGA